MTDEQNGGFIRAKIQDIEKTVDSHFLRLNNHGDRLQQLEMKMSGLPEQVEKNTSKINGFTLRFVLLLGVVVGGMNEGLGLLSALIRWATNGGG